MIERILFKSIEKRLWRQKAVLLLGPRQVGKTTLVRQLLAQSDAPSAYFNGDDPAVRQLFDAPSLERLRQIVGPARLIVIDEAQRLRDIGLTLKMLVDEMPDRQVIATGSSALDLASAAVEPLTGRKFEHALYPISWAEWTASVGLVAAMSGLENRLLFGMYPEILNAPGDEKESLALLASSYLYKDLLAIGNIRKPDLLEKLLQALALQIGSEVSLNELSNTLGIDKKTVSSYIDLLEKAFVIFRLGPLSGNLRNEISSNRKVFFWDIGIRNALLGNFSPLALRPDAGAIWENFLIAERLKRNRYAERWFASSFFWRVAGGGEIDFVEREDGQISAFEIKWNPTSKARLPVPFAATYPAASFLVITPANFHDWLLMP